MTLPNGWSELDRFRQAGRLLPRLFDTRPFDPTMDLARGAKGAGLVLLATQSAAFGAARISAAVTRMRG